VRRKRKLKQGGVYIYSFLKALRYICKLPELKLTGHRELHLWPPLYRA
jgi:hypothetical protein